MPSVTLASPSRSSANPIATTSSPTRTRSGSASVAGCRPVTSTWSNARSLVGIGGQHRGDARLELAVEAHADLVGAVDHVGVGEDLPIRGEHHAGADTLAVEARLADVGRDGDDARPPRGSDGGDIEPLVERLVTWPADDDRLLRRRVCAGRLVGLDSGADEDAEQPGDPCRGDDGHRPDDGGVLDRPPPAALRLDGDDRPAPPADDGGGIGTNGSLGRGGGSALGMATCLAASWPTSHARDRN